LRQQFFYGLQPSSRSQLQKHAALRSDSQELGSSSFYE
jgi:hypothetical protein